jgi:hypothetical protein
VPTFTIAGDQGSSESGGAGAGDLHAFREDLRQLFADAGLVAVVLDCGIDCVSELPQPLNGFAAGDPVGQLDWVRHLRRVGRVVGGAPLEKLGRDSAIESSALTCFKANASRLDELTTGSRRA